MERDRRIHTDTSAEFLKKNAGKPYRPSNGTEGEIFMSAWCADCSRDAVMNGSKSGYWECSDKELCDILGRTMALDADDPNYPKEWIYGEDGQPKCTAFQSKADGDAKAAKEAASYRCEKTLDMFPDE